MTRDEWVAQVEAASGMSIQQFELLGLEVIELTCRRLECLGFHFARTDRSATDPIYANEVEGEPAPIAPDPPAAPVPPVEGESAPPPAESQEPPPQQEGSTLSIDVDEGTRSR